MATIGYARVSTDGQSLDAQVAELTSAGAGRVFKETISGARSDRIELKRAIAAVERGDLLVVTRLDRLARSPRDLLNCVATLSEKGVDFRSLRDTWADTTTPHGRRYEALRGRYGDRIRIPGRYGDRIRIPQFSLRDRCGAFAPSRPDCFTTGP